jgi:hypothetical protein
MSTYYLHIDCHTAEGALTWFDGVVEAPSLEAAARQAEERAVRKSSTTSPPVGAPAEGTDS